MPVSNRRPPRILWIEGKDDNAVVQSLCEAHGVPEDFHVHNAGGIEPLLDGFPVQLRERHLQRFGIVVDADADPAARWAAIRDRLRNEGYSDVPDHPTAGGTVVRAPLLPWFGIWVMPDNARGGALEDFAAGLVPDEDVLWPRVVEVIDGIPQNERRFSVERRVKAHIHTWLAWQEEPGSPMGQAIGKGDLDANAPLARAFVSWLRRLMIDDA